MVDDEGLMDEEYAEGEEEGQRALDAQRSVRVARDGRPRTQQRPVWPGSLAAVVCDSLATHEGRRRHGWQLGPFRCVCL
ncbi:MAG: hypothetical protein WDW38_010585 [Sanguina aurantia]